MSRLFRSTRRFRWRVHARSLPSAARFLKWGNRAGLPLPPFMTTTQKTGDPRGIAGLMRGENPSKKNQRRRRRSARAPIAPKRAAEGSGTTVTSNDVSPTVPVVACMLNDVLAAIAKGSTKVKVLLGAAESAMLTPPKLKTSPLVKITKLNEVISTSWLNEKVAISFTPASKASVSSPVTPSLIPNEEAVAFNWSPDAASEAIERRVRSRDVNPGTVTVAAGVPISVASSPSSNSPSSPDAPDALVKNTVAA